MDLNARVDVNCGWKDGWKTRCLYCPLLKQVPQKMAGGHGVVSIYPKYYSAIDHQREKVYVQTDNQWSLC